MSRQDRQFEQLIDPQLLNFDVEVAPYYTCDEPDDNPPDLFRDDEIFAIRRTDTNAVIGRMNKARSVIPHYRVLDAVRNAFDETNLLDVERSRLFARSNGSEFRAQIFFPGVSAVVGAASRDVIWQGFTITSVLDKKPKITVEDTIYRLACANGMRIPMKECRTVFAHEKFDSIVLEAFLKALIEKSAQSLTYFSHWAQTPLRDLPVTQHDVKHYVNFVYSFNSRLRMLEEEDASDLIGTNRLQLPSGQNLLEVRKNHECQFPVKLRDSVAAFLEKEFNLSGQNAWALYNAFNSAGENKYIHDGGKIDKNTSIENNAFRLFGAIFGYSNKKEAA